MKIREDLKSKSYTPPGSFSTIGDRKEELDKIIADITCSRPEKIRCKNDLYIDPETKELWTYACNHNCWMNQGDPVPYLIFRINKYKCAKKKKIEKETINVPIEETITIKDTIKIGDEKITKNKRIPVPMIPKIKDFVNITKLELKYGMPKEEYLPNNKNFMVVDVTPSSNSGYKIKYDFINFMSRYFVGKSIYLIGDRSKYALDYFLNLRPNTLWLTDKTKDEIFTYIAHSKRFYCFTSSEYIYSAIELNIKPITIFYEKDEVLWNVPDIDYVCISKDPGLEIIADNIGNVLNK